MLTPLVGRRWREERLTVNYRTPAEIMAVAADVLASVVAGRAAAGLGPLRGGGPPRGPVPPPGRLPAARAGRDRAPAWPSEAVRADLAEIGGPDARPSRGHRAGRADRLALSAAVPEAIPGDQPESLDSAAALLTVSQAKGLEFDRVIVADPSGILAQSQNGGHDLYVAITRATHRLTIVHEGDAARRCALRLTPLSRVRGQGYRGRLPNLSQAVSPGLAAGTGYVPECTKSLS